MADINPIISTIMLNVTGLKNSIKRQKLSDSILKSKIKLQAICKTYTLDFKIQID